MNKKDYLKDISHIKTLMGRSSLYPSLSGLSSVYTGIYCLIGAVYFYTTEITTHTYSPNVAIAVFLLLVGMSLLTSIYFTKKRAQELHEKAWTHTTKQLLTTFSITFSIGAAYILVLVFQEKYEEIIPLVPLVYGLSLLHAAKHTENMLRPLGIAQVIIAFLCMLFIEQSFWFYTLGFGVIHLVNGLIIYYTYDKK